MKTIIAVFGNAGHGKSTLANIFANLTGGRVINFADPVKLVGKHMVGIPLKVSHGTQEDKAAFTKYGKTAREHLQRIGTEFGRDGIGNTVWVDRFLDTAIEAMSGKEDTVVISGDGRFPDEEFLYLKTEAAKASIKVIGVVIRRPSRPVNMEHRSESVIANTDDSVFDYVVLNNGTELELRERAWEIVGAGEGLAKPPAETKAWRRKDIEEDRGKDYIRTFTGLKFWPLDARPDEVMLEDIAHGTSGENRWSGMTRTRINVAWHSNRVRRLALIVAPPKLKLLAGLYAQLHDAHEAYFKDIPRPVKNLLPGYEESAGKLDRVIFEHFGLEPVMPSVIFEIVETCDQWMAGVEARAWHNLTEDELPPKPPIEIIMACGGYLTREPDPDEDEREFVFHTIELLKALEMPYGAI